MVEAPTGRRSLPDAIKFGQLADFYDAADVDSGVV